MENILYIYNINTMNRGQAYREAKNLATELGYDLAPLRQQWRYSTTEYWRNEVRQYQRNIRNRDRRYNVALRISRENREPLLRQAITRGTDYAYWNREVRRLQMRARRNPIAVQNVQQARNRVAPILAQVRQPDNLQRQARRRQQRRVRQIQQELQQQARRQETQRRINRMITGNQFQNIFNMVVNDNQTLTNQQAQRVWNNITGQGNHILTITFEDGRTQIIALNNTTRDFFIEILINGLIVEEKEQQYGSDIIDNLNFRDIQSLEISRLNRPQRQIRNRDGRFFPYINTTDEDLSKYQIFNQKQAYDKKLIAKREHCLTHTLLQAGIHEAVVNSIKMSYIKGVAIRKKDLHNISNIIKRNINVHTMNGRRIAIQKIKADEPDQNPDGTLKDDINIALYENHYFIFENTKYSKYSIIHYEELKDEENFNHIIKIIKGKNNKKYFTRDEEKSKINSLLLVDKFYKAQYFKKLNLIKFEESTAHQELKEHIYLNNIENEQRIRKEKEDCFEDYKEEEEKEFTKMKKMSIGDPRIKKYLKFLKDRERKSPNSGVYYADCESFTQGTHHKLYLLGVVNDRSDIVDIYNVCDQPIKDNVSQEQQVIYKFFSNVTKNGKQDALVYFHNLKYDYHLMEHLINIKRRCEKDGQIYNVICGYKGMEIELRDSYKILPFALSKFGEEFGLPHEIRKKEAIAYNYYTFENNNRIIKTRQYRDLLSSKEKVIFKEAVKQCPSYDPQEKTFNPLTYYQEYLRLDCLVLKKGIQKFNNLIQQITENKMSVYECLTISSLTDKYMKMEGAYDGVYEVQGNLRAYIAKAVYGGRVCVNKKYKKKIIEGKISDYDGVSLYPSAINRLCRELGLPKGKAVRYTKEDLKNWDTKIYSILTVKINKVNKIQQMPFIAHKTEDSIKYTNTPLKENLIIDSITLQDYITFHKIDYELLDGVYWNNGSNKKMGEVIQRLFNARLKAKKDEKNALSNTIKLMLNSAYGKTIMKKSKTETKIIKTERKEYNEETKKWEVKSKTNFNDYVYNNFNTIKNYRKLNDNTYEVENICADNSYNRGHIGCAILSMSKRIMNEVFDVANDNKYPIYYTDTDSLHCNLEDVPKLEAKYKERYNKELNGKQLEQFHTDFNMLDENGQPRQGKGEEIYATKSIFLGKKSYIDYLESKDENGNTIHGFHVRLKGITKEGLEHTAKQYNNSYIGLYEDLAKGNEKEIILNPYNPDTNENKVLFEFKEGKVSTKKSFTRIVKF